MIGLSRGSSIVAAGADGKALVLWTLWTQRTKRNGRQHHGCRETVGSDVSIRNTSVICRGRYGSPCFGLEVGGGSMDSGDEKEPPEAAVSEAAHPPEIGRASCRECAV